MEDVVLRRATASDAQEIGAVFDAAVRNGRTSLGEPAQRRLFTAGQWEELVDAPPDAPPHPGRGIGTEERDDRARVGLRGEPLRELRPVKGP